MMTLICVNEIIVIIIIILRTDCIKDLGVYIDCKLHFHQHVDYLFCHAMKLLGLIHTLTFSFSTLNSLLMLFFALGKSKLEYASVAWNSVTATDSNKLERVRKKIAVICHNFFYIEYHYDIISEKLNLQTLRIRRRQIDALFLINAFCGTKYCPSVLETVGLRVPTRDIVISPRSVAPSATALQQDVYLLPMQFVNL
jgi:hypothetical protein